MEAIVPELDHAKHGDSTEPSPMNGRAHTRLLHPSWVNHSTMRPLPSLALHPKGLSAPAISLTGNPCVPQSVK